MNPESVIRATVGTIIVILLFIGLYALDARKETCELVGCFGWSCHMGGTGCGMPIPSGGWQPGQTKWDGM